MDRVVCVDAAYHFPKRAALLTDLARSLRPDGRAGWSDLVLTGRSSQPGAVVAGLLGFAGIPKGNVTNEDGYRCALEGAGWRDVRVERVDDAVLGGFVGGGPTTGVATGSGRACGCAQS